MWKALIKLVEKWGYRCDHKWKLINQSKILDREMYKKGIEINARIEFTYVCEKCLLSKKIT